MTDFSQKRFLIIAGQPKAGTTSLFDWMAQHPDIAPSTLKETRYFLDDDYPLPRPKVSNKGDLSGYAKMFPDTSSDVLLEATPDYMFSSKFLDVAELLPNAYAVVVVRKSEDRLISAFRFFKQRGLIAKGESFDAWIKAQATLQLQADIPVYLRALDHCKLEKYLPELRRTWQDRLIEVPFATLKAAPDQVTNMICERLGLAAMPQIDDLFTVSNKSKTTRWPVLSRIFHRVRREISQILASAIWVRMLLKPLSRMLSRALETGTSFEKVSLSPETRALIAEHAGVAQSFGQEN